MACKLQSLWRIPNAAARCSPYGESLPQLQAAVPVENFYRSCKLTRVRSRCAKALFCVVTIAGAHGLWLMPVMLFLVGGESLSRVVTLRSVAIPIARC